ncbi:13303_t:CDS:2 [Dentiscutata erythropus]|uniref:Ribonuclease H n=1 Tax=Dentiscutata erythropus TaxID=1348616 RepID=A0A9N9NTZ6_9GLOM|nr:13303_t:CDS:2 [Dentiscutata erythropus]
MSLQFYSTIEAYYAVRKGRESGIYTSWEKCQEQVNGCSGALFKKFYTRQQAENYIKIDNFDDDVLNIWTDKYPKINVDLVLRMNDLIKNRERKTYFKHVKAHSGVYGNEQADRLVFLDSQKEFWELNLEPVKGKIYFYFKKEKKNDSDNAMDSYLLEFVCILNLLEQDVNKEKLVIQTQNKNIYLILEENQIEKWLKNDWCNTNK